MNKKQIKDIVWKSFLKAELADENWHDEHTAKDITDNLLKYLETKKQEYINTLEQLKTEIDWSDNGRYALNSAIKHAEKIL